MTNLVLSTSIRNLTAHVTLHRSYHVGKASSVNTAIARGLRKSKGMGFRGKAVADPNDPREKYRKRHDIPEYKALPKEDRFEPNSDDRSSYFNRDSNRSKYGADEARSHNGNGLKAGSRTAGGYGRKNTSAIEIDGPAVEPRRGRFGEIIGFPRRIKVSGRHDRGRNSRGLDRAPKPSSRFRERFSSRDGFQDRPSNASGKHRTSPFSMSNSSPRSRSEHSDRDASQGKFPRSSQGPSTERVLNFGNKATASKEDSSYSKETTPTKPRFTQTIHNRIPLSIPYTTPASEFLYGTSVVEAALTSHREPRRKLYKLYIYTGENREDTNRDTKIERLAQRNGVQVMRVGNDWARAMDKMSAGRPHNGFILEASPLPRLPVLHLGKLKTVDGQHGFGVAVDHQSREEAAINGTASFVTTTSNTTERNPFVLLLDSIVDPGNLGGIIRTASFLGVSAIAISARNSAPLSPVVLKASVGASENVALFTVNKPAGFIVGSKANGWRVFAAVAPSRKGDPAMPLSMSTDDLNDPLSEAPCILMLGSEGEGLRWNLRGKADVDLYVQGCGKSHNVDSLNVSVATGILCKSFLRSDSKKKLDEIEHAPEQSVPHTPARDLF